MTSRLQRLATPGRPCARVRSMSSVPAHPFILCFGASTVVYGLQHALRRVCGCSERAKHRLSSISAIESERLRARRSIVGDSLPNPAGCVRGGARGGSAFHLSWLSLPAVALPPSSTPLNFPLALLIYSPSSLLPLPPPRSLPRQGSFDNPDVSVLVHLISSSLPFLSF